MRIFDKEFHSHAVNHVLFLVFESKHLGYLPESFGIHEYEAVAMQFYGSFEGRYYEVHRGVDVGRGCNVGIDDSIDRFKQRHYGVDGRNHFQ